MQIRNFNFNQTKINTFIIDTYSGNYLWLGFVKDGTTCNLKKVSANNPLQTYFTLDVAIDTWKKFAIYSQYLYTAVDDSSVIGIRYALTTPLVISTNFTKPDGITEAPIDIQVTSNYVFFLLPGLISGENAKICKFNLTGTFIETIDLSLIQNASSFTVIDDTNLWVVTNTEPTSLIRIWNDGSWNYSIN